MGCLITTELRIGERTVAWLTWILTGAPAQPVDLALQPESRDLATRLALVLGGRRWIAHRLHATWPRRSGCSRRRPRTRVDHLARVSEHLGYTMFERPPAAALAGWLRERAVEYDAPSVLLALACEHLRARRIMRPSPDRLLRLIATAGAGAHQRIEAALAKQLPPARRAQLDELLTAPAGGRSEPALLSERAGVAELRPWRGRLGKTLRPADAKEVCGYCLPDVV